MAEQKTLYTLQALRALAAAAVAFTHTVETIYHHMGIAPTLFSALRVVGLSGVDLFFVLSGFIMFYTTQHLPTGKPSALDFIRKRIIRIMPIYWILTTVLLLIYLISPDLITWLTLDFVHVLTSYFLIPYPDSLDRIKPLLGVGWTLSYEMYFYLIIMVLLWCVRARLPVVTLFFSLCVLAGLYFQPQSYMMQFFTDELMLEFVIGSMAAVYLRHYRLPCPLLWCFAGVGWYIYSFDVYMALGYRSSSVGIAFGLIILGLAAWEKTKNPAVPSLLIALGNSSYALYLSHAFPQHAVIKLWSATLGNKGYLALVFVVWIISIAVGHLVYLWLEKPINARLRRKTRDMTRTPVFSLAKHGKIK